MIKEELERQERSIAWFGSKINRSRQNCYYIFSKPEIDTLLLISICKALNHNFFRDIAALIEQEIYDTSV
jgi:hypothetical protein